MNNKKTSLLANYSSLFPASNFRLLSITVYSITICSNKHYQNFRRRYLIYSVSQPLYTEHPLSLE